MSHDLAAELAGYRAELLSAQQTGNSERETAVHAEIERVGNAIAAQARAHAAQAQVHDNSGQHVLAAQARAHAANLTGVLTEAGVDLKSDPEKAIGAPPAVEDTSDTTPKQTAVTRRGRTNKES